jgi:hypothetical protein
MSGERRHARKAGSPELAAGPADFEGIEMDTKIPAEIVVQCKQCERSARLVYLPTDTESCVTWSCPARACHAHQGLDLKGTLIKAYALYREAELRSIV